MAMDALKDLLRAEAQENPQSLAGLVKDVAVLVKLVRNPGKQPTEPKFKKVKLSNATISRVLSRPGALDVMTACGFVADATGESLEQTDTSASAAAVLLHTADAVESVQHTLQELHWLHESRGGVPSLATQPWVAADAAMALVKACLTALHAPGDPGAAEKVGWVQRLHVALTAPELVETRAIVMQHSSVVVTAVRRVALALVHAGVDVPSLVAANKCLAHLAPPGDPRTVDSRVDFCFAYLEASLPADDESMELSLRLTRERLLESVIEALGAFSEVGIRCGVLRQPLTIEYQHETGQDAGGLRRQFFDLFTSELAASALWTRTAAGGLRPADEAALRPSGAPTYAMRPGHMEACGRVCGMALYQELHRRRDSTMLDGREEPPYLLGSAFARYFVRVVQHDLPASLPELQAELANETEEASPDFRAGAQILEQGVSQSGLLDQTFVRAVGDVEVPLVDGGAAINVTDENKHAWLEALLRAELLESFHEAATHFRKGLVDVIGLARAETRTNVDIARWTTPHFCLLSAEELQRQWSGAPVNREFVDELRREAVVHAEVHEQAEWLWEVMLSVDDEMRAKVFRFITGSSRRPCTGPVQFRIGPKEGGDGAYPFAHACASQLDVPAYTSQAVLRERLEAATLAAHDKFTDL